MTTPQRKPIDVVPVVIFLCGVLFSGFGAYALFDSRVTRVETTVENSQLAQVPARLATIEANQNQVLGLLRSEEGKRK